jgi:membrane fusion protein, multidrug efflux system
VILVKGGKAVPVPVKAGDEVGSRTVIESGVRPGDVVVTTGQVRLQPDAPVKVAAAPTPAR